MTTPNKKRPSAAPRESAFNLRLPADLLERIDGIIEGGPTPLSRNQFIQRVLSYFADEFEWENRHAEGKGTAHLVAGYFAEVIGKGREQDR